MRLFALGVDGAALELVDGALHGVLAVAPGLVLVAVVELQCEPFKIVLCALQVFLLQLNQRAHKVQLRLPA